MKYRFFCVLGGIILLTACGGSSSSKKDLNANDTTPSYYDIVKILLRLKFLWRRLFSMEIL